MSLRVLMRGLGGSAGSGLITSGFGTVADEVVRIIRGGRSAASRLAKDYEERFKIGAMLIQANGKELLKPIFNTVTKRFIESNSTKVTAATKRLSYRKPKQPIITVNTISVRNKKNERN
jgi:hypothetical protein